MVIIFWGDSMYKVLIADDEAKVVELIKKLICWEVLKLEIVGVAHNGIEAMEKINRFEPDIVITDIRMPGCDGLELIKETKMKFPNIDFIIVSGYQHFDYAHNAIKYGVKDYLLKPLNKDEINRTLSNLVSKYETEKKAVNEMGRIVNRINQDKEIIRAEFSNRFFSDFEKTLKETNYEDLSKKFFLNFDKEVYQLLVLKPDIKYQVGKDELLKLLMEKSKSILEKNIRPIPGTSIAGIQEDRVFMLVNYDYKSRATVKNVLIRSIDEITSLRDIFKSINVTIALSDEVTSFDQLSLLKAQVNRRLFDKLLSATNRLIESDLISEGDDRYLDYWDESLKSALTQKIRELDFEGYTVVFNQWISSILVSNKITGRGYSILAQNVIRMTLEVMLRFQLVDEGYANQYQISQIEMAMARNVSQLMEMSLSYIHEFFKHAISCRKERSRKPVEQAVVYINEHFVEAISLEQVSGLVGFNPSYFSVLFKKEMGQNFLEYVTSVRIQYAQNALSDASKTISTIAMDSGYNDMKHFSKQFKKITGLTPAKYRKLYY
jgi:two-component system response regulator YesN